MTDKTVAQFEALQWAWTLGKDMNNVQEYRDEIRKTLMRLGEGEVFDFKEKTGSLF